MSIYNTFDTIEEIPQKTNTQYIKDLAALDRPLNVADVKESFSRDITPLKENIKDLDKPLNQNETSIQDNEVSPSQEQKIEGVEKMSPQIEIKFTCPEGMDRKEFTRQLKGQERGINSQSVLENMINRTAFEQRKLDTGNGRNIEIGQKAQEIARQKATQSRILSNQKKGMSYSEAKVEADSWIKDQAALHNPDQIAGGDPAKVSRMGDAKVNSSIGSQWRKRVDILADGVDAFAQNKSAKELSDTKMNVRLVVV